MASTNQSTRTCYWGELLSTASRARGGTGTIIDSYTRDSKKIIPEMGYPVFSTGFKPVPDRFLSQSTVVDLAAPSNAAGSPCARAMWSSAISMESWSFIEILAEVVQEAAEGRIRKRHSRHAAPGHLLHLRS
ncbi:MAG: hypothetical protein R2848_00050 [Thermomicrobiales bacterium]